MASDVRPLPAHLQELIDLLPLGEPVHQRVVFESYGRRPEYARRIRKIVAEYGWDIERVRGKSGRNDDYYIRRSSGPVQKQRIRTEVPPAKRAAIYERDGWVCQICRRDVSGGQRATKAQCDHKVPAERGGRPVAENLQTLCVTCNLKKRQACAGCPLSTCDGCEYAWPERLAAVVVIRLDAVEATALANEAAGRPIDDVARGILSRALRSL